MILTWLLAAALALPLPAAQQTAPPVEIHPLLLGPLSDPASPVVRELTAQAAGLSELAAYQALSPALVSQFLAPKLAGSAVERPAAAILARVVADPSAAALVLKNNPILKTTELPSLSGAALTASAGASVEERSALRELQTAAAKDPYAKLAFDGFTPPTGLDGLTMTGQGPKPQAGGELQRLGSGSFGMVHEHPKVAGAVIKTIFYPKDWGLEARRKMYEFALDDERTARKLAQAGVGPRLLAHTDELGSPVLIKERIFGSSVYELIKDQIYTMRHHRMILALIDRLAEAGLVPDDLREPNIMIGRTLLDDERRAYLIDGGSLDWPAGRSRRAIARRIYRGPARWVSKDPDGAQVLKTKPLNQILEEALVDSGSAGWWTRLKVKWRRWRGTDLPTVEPY